MNVWEGNPMDGLYLIPLSVGIVALLVGMGAVHPAVAESLPFDNDGMLMVDGKRFFPVGIYEFPRTDEQVKEIAEAGFNLIQSSAGAEDLDRARSAGLKAWIPLGAYLDAKDEGQQKTLAEIVNRFKDHPALIVWEGPDEPLWNVWSSTSTWFRDGQTKLFRSYIEEAEKTGTDTSAMKEQFRVFQASVGIADYPAAEDAASKLWSVLGKPSPHPELLMTGTPQRARELADGLYAGRELIRQIDPNHPIWINHAPRNTIPDTAYFNRAAHIAGCDIYPVPDSPENGHSDIANHRLSCVGDYTDRMQAAAPGKPIWTVLQGFGWGDLSEASSDLKKAGRRPTYDETRFMAYDAIVHGAKGILYWGTAYIQKPSEFWTCLKRVVGELREIQHVLAAPVEPTKIQVVLDPTSDSVDKGIVVLAKRADNRVHLIVVNEFPAPQRCTVSGLPAPDGTTLRDNLTKKTVSVTNGQINCSLGGYGVAVLMQE